MTDEYDKRQDKDETRHEKDRETVTHFAAAGRGRPCPICGKPAKSETRPFCSKRCADIDLGRWLGENYRIPAVEPPDGADLDDANLEGGGPGGRPHDGETGRKSR